MDIYREWLKTKAEIDRMKTKLLELENEIIKGFQVPTEGQKTFKQESFRVTLKQPICRKTTNDQEYLELTKEIPEEMHPHILKVNLVIKGCKWLAENEPGYWRIISKAIIENPGKINVQVKEVKK